MKKERFTYLQFNGHRVGKKSCNISISHISELPRAMSFIHLQVFFYTMHILICISGMNEFKIHFHLHENIVTYLFLTLFSGLFPSRQG